MSTSTSSGTGAYEKQHQVIGAGPAGLVAAATLARSGRSVHVADQGDEVGHRFSGDFQGLENWSTTQDVLSWMSELGVRADFEYEPFHEVTFYDRHLNPTLARATTGPLFYLIRRGPEEGSLDRALLDQALAAGATVTFGRRAKKAERGDIVATGPRYADGLVTGFVFPTALENQARCIVSESMAPAGYAYLLACDGRATLATCSFRRERNWKDARDLAVAAFIDLVPSLPSELDHARPFSGQGSVFPTARYSDEAGRLFVGEAAGLQDPEWGFGLRYALESGVLAATSLIEGTSYQATAAAVFNPRIRAEFANRIMFEALPQAAIPPLLRRNAASPDLRRRLYRHWRPTAAKSILARATRSRFTSRRLRHSDRACHSETCTCVWCTHGDPQLEHSHITHFHG